MYLYIYMTVTDRQPTSSSQLAAARPPSGGAGAAYAQGQSTGPVQQQGQRRRSAVSVKPMRPGVPHVDCASARLLEPELLDKAIRLLRERATCVEAHCTVRLGHHLG